MSTEETGKMTVKDFAAFLKTQGYSQADVARFKKRQQERARLDSKQVEKVLMANKRDKLKALCRNVAAAGHAHLYVSVLGDKVILTGIEQLKARPKPFNRRGFGSTNHTIGAAGATAIKLAKAKGKKAPSFSALSPERRKEISRRGGLAAAAKRKAHKAAIAARGLHWTQKPENRQKVVDQLARAAAMSKAKRAKGVA